MIFYRRRSVAACSRAQGPDQSRAPLVYRSAVRAPGIEPFHGVLSPQGGERGGPRRHERDRPYLHGSPYERLADNKEPARSAGPYGGKKPRRAPYAAYGFAGHLSEAAYVLSRRGAQDLPLPAQNDEDHRTGPGLRGGHYVHTDGARLPLSRGRNRLEEPQGAFSPRLEHAGRGFLRRRARGGHRSLRRAGCFQYGPGGAVHVGSVHRRAEGAQSAHLDGRQGSLARQRVRGALLAQPEAGGSVPACVRDGGRGQKGDRRLRPLLQRRTPAPGP